MIDKLLADALGLPAGDLAQWLGQAFEAAPVGGDAKDKGAAVLRRLEQLLAGRTVAGALVGPPLAAIGPDDAGVNHRIDELAAGRPDPGPGRPR